MPLKSTSSPVPCSSCCRSFLTGVLLAVAMLIPPAWKQFQSHQQNRFDFQILQAAGESGVDPSLIKAVIWRESKFDPDRRGEDGEFGLMQVMGNVGEEWAKSRGLKDFKPESLSEPLTNIRVGSWYLSKAIQQWSKASEPIPLALASYNAGRSNVLKWVDATSLADDEHFINRIEFPSTRSYVRNILQQYRFYRMRGEF